MSKTFAERWRRKELDCGYGDNASKMVACGGDVLPEDAAPFLSFKEAAHPLPIYEVYWADWSSADCERLDGYRMIGADEADNPVCIEQATGAVVSLDHEDQFYTRQFINSSVRQLAECLLAYMGENDATRFRAAVQAIDPAAMAEERFWWYEANMVEDRPNWPPLPDD
jgi:hypothetical protein